MELGIRKVGTRGADLAFAARPEANSQANVKSKAPMESIFSSGPSIPKFEIVPTEKRCECWTWTAGARVHLTLTVGLIAACLANVMLVCAWL
jgi:hypothetical protein